MAETSFYWSGSSVGDATLAPYTDDQFTDNYRKLFSYDRTVQGILRGAGNELAATGTGSPVAINTGMAIVDGKIYENSASLNVTVPTPASATRIDRIMLRKSWAAQTVRITRVAGVEGGGVPALTQVDGVTWDLPLWQASITTGGVITLTKEGVYVRSPLAAPAQYVVTQDESGLPDAVNIPGLAGSPDTKGAAGGGIELEWDDDNPQFTWTATPDTVDSDTTVKSHLYIKDNADVEMIGSVAWAPAGAFDARIGGVGLGQSNGASTKGYTFGLHIGDSGNAKRLLVNIHVAPSTQIQTIRAFTYATGSYTQRGSDWDGRYAPYLRITRDGSNNCSFFFSSDGKVWQHIATQALTLTVDNIGVNFTAGAGNTDEFDAVADWIRTDV